MPAFMKMRLSNGNPTPAQLANHSQKLAEAPRVITPSSLKSAMISRIHTLKPGCGGCGRH
jgi:hypothetical protein